MSRLWPRSSVWIILFGIVCLVGLVGCGDGSGEAGQGEEEAAGDEREQSGVNRIAYIDNSGDLYLISPDGSGDERITGDFRAGLLGQALDRNDSYAWPTWSPDGTRLAVSRITSRGSAAGLSVQVYDLAAGQMTSAFVNDLPAPVAEGTPHYLYWAPNGQQLGVLAPTPEGLALYVRDLQGARDAAPVAVGGPLYFHWSADSGLLAVHSGDRVAIQEPTAGGQVSRVAVDALAFRAPALSPDGSTLAYAAVRGGVQGIYLASVQAPDAAPSMLVTLEGSTAFSWAPDGSALAVAEQQRPGAPVFDSLRLISPDGQEDATLVDQQMMAFFWSPQGDAIAWIGLDPASRSMDLTVSPVAAGKPSGEPRHLFRFNPTGELFTMLSFFDQYAYSHSLWAPDGSALVVTSNEGLESGRRNGSGPSGGDVIVVDVGTGDARRIASGKLAFWSWN